MADIIVIAIIALCIFLGYKRGLIKVAVRIVSFVLALVIALVLYTPVSNYIIEKTDIVPNLEDTIYTKLYNGEEVEKEVSEDAGFVQMMENYIDKYKDEATSNTSELISEQIAIIIVRIGTWIGLFIVSKLILLFIRLFTDAIAEIPIIKQFNKARRNNIWNFRRFCNNLCITCNI